MRMGGGGRILSASGRRKWVAHRSRARPASVRAAARRASAAALPTPYDLVVYDERGHGRAVHDLVQRIQERAPCSTSAAAANFFNPEGPLDDVLDVAGAYPGQAGATLLVCEKSADGAVVGCGALTTGTPVAKNTSGLTYAVDLEIFGALRRICVSVDEAADAVALLQALIERLSEAASSAGAVKLIALGYEPLNPRKQCAPQQPFPELLVDMGFALSPDGPDFPISGDQRVRQFDKSVFDSAVDLQTR